MQARPRCPDTSEVMFCDLGFVTLRYSETLLQDVPNTSHWSSTIRATMQLVPKLDPLSTCCPIKVEAAFLVFKHQIFTELDTESLSK